MTAPNPSRVRETLNPRTTTTPEGFTRAVADATRLRILMLLLDQDELCVCQLMDVLGLPQPKISRHLAVLRQACLLRDRRAGLWIHYRIRPDLPEWAREALIAIGKGCAGTQPFEADRASLSRLPIGPTAICGG